MQSCHQMNIPEQLAAPARRGVQRMEEVDCRGFLRKGDLLSEVRKARFWDKNGEIARHPNKPGEAPSWPHPCRDAAVSPPALYALVRSSPWAPKHPTKTNSAWPRLQSASIRQPTRPPHANSCIADYRNVLAVTSQEQFPIHVFVAYKIHSLQTRAPMSPR
jgi:hypothetical protein